MKKQSFLYGATVLAAASILCKIMSAALKIPLDRLFLHEEGIGVYQSAYSIYNVFLAICVTGIPIALSCLVAESEEDRQASLVKSAYVAISVFGIVSAAAMLIFAKPLARLLSGGGEAVAAPSLMVLSPALLVMGIISSRKGYFQGKRNMTPSATGQLAESIVKVVMGIAACAFSVKWGIKYGAAGAISGVTLGAVAQAAVLEASFRRQKVKKAAFSGKLAMSVLKMSVPMTLGAFGFTAVMLVDTLTVPELLAGSGVAETQRLKLFGYLTRSYTIYNLPATVISAFTASAVPAIACVKGDKMLLGESSVRVIKLVFLAALPCALGIMLFPKEILSLVYSSENHWQLLFLVGIMVAVMPYVQTTTAMLQTLGSIWSPIWVTVGAVGVKIVLNFILIKSFGVEGAPLATVISFAPAFIINTLMLKRHTSLKSGGRITGRIALCAAVSCGGARLIYGMREGTMMLLLCVGLAAAVYMAAVLLTGCIKREEFTGGDKS